jgi:Zn-dependent peptidase ImmA (M78 family)
MTGQELAQKVVAKYATTDVLAIAKLLNINVMYEKWHPSTVGEFDKKTKTICINLNAEMPPLSILAHELGHYFLNEMNTRFERNEEEIIVEAFANALGK